MSRFIIKCQQLDFTKEKLLAPVYHLNRVFPQSGASTATLTVAGGNETIFEIPVKPVNFTKSYLQFDVTIPATPLVAGNVNFAHLNTVPYFRSVYLYTRGGVYACQLDEAQTYTNLSFHPNIKLEDFLDLGNAVAVNGATDDDPGVPLPPTDASQSAGLTGINSCFQRNNSTVNSTVALRPGLGLTNSDVNYTEPQYVIQSDDEVISGENSSRSTFNMHVRIPLFYFRDTVFDVDRDILFNEIMYMRLVWNGVNKIAYFGTTNANPDTGAATVGNAAAVGGSTLGLIQVTSLQLYLAIEKNQHVINVLQEQILSGGLSYLIPYVHYFKNSPNASTSQSVTIRFNRGHGAKLIKIYHSIYNLAESLNLAYEHNNINGAKLQRYYTQLDNERIQEFELICTKLDDWSLMRENLAGTPLQTSNIYQYNWFHMDRFDGLNAKDDDTTNLDTGLDLSIERKWDIYCQAMTNTQYAHYTFAVAQKVLTISSVGVTCT